MEDKRKVVVYKWKKVEGQSQFDKVADGNGIFHAFGVDYEESTYGVGTFSTAIVEMTDGSMRNVAVDLIIFNN